MATSTKLHGSLAFLLFVAAISSAPSLTSSASPSCPIDYSSYMTEYFPSICLGSNLSSPSNDCCLASFNVFGLGIGIYLRDHQIFELPDNATVYACIDAYQSSLQSNGLQGFSVLKCSQFADPEVFIKSPYLCSGIETVADWKSKVGSTAMDSSCKGDLSSSAVCQVCDTDVQTAISIASNLSVNHSSCFYYGVLYASAIVNENGPTNPATAACLLALNAKISSSNKSNHIVIYASVGAAVAFVGLVVLATMAWLWWLRKRRLYHQKFVKKNKKLISSSLHPNVGAIWYKFDDVKAATNNFASVNIIGEGGFATVYKGVMVDGAQVAIKRIKNCTPEGDLEFKNEVDVINSVRHRNLLALRGCCVASNTSLGHLRLLIYDYMQNGSLEDYIFSGKKPLLQWAERRKIAIDTARGLAYLHTGVQPAIIHRDIKANNILLDEHLNARVADFGLAKVIAEGLTHMTTRVAGTQGYLAPEYALYGQLTEKSDVYSFGVLLLVLMSGRQALDIRGAFPLITDWAWVMVKKGNPLGIVDERIRSTGPADLMERFILVGILCAHLLVAFRPSMSQALKMLQGDMEIPEIPDRPLPLTHDSILSLDVEIPEISDQSSILAHDSNGLSIEMNSSFSSLPSTAPQCTYNAEDLLR